MVGGVSFLVLKRDEFGAILERDGPEALLDYMRASSVQSRIGVPAEGFALAGRAR